MPRAIADQITIAQADGTLPLPYDLLVDAQDRVQWWDRADSDDPMPPGKTVFHEWRFWGGGMGETQDLGRGGYYYSENMYHGDPFALKPRPTLSIVTLTDNANPIERMFHEKDASDNYYLYCLAQTKSFKVKVSDQTLKETKVFAGPGTIFAQGTYEGTGATKNITGLTFQPAVVIVKGNLAQLPVIKTADIAGTNSKPWSASVFTATGITSLDADGFTVETDATVNTNGETYYWYAWKALAGVTATGTYAGDAADDRDITGVGFKPVLVHVIQAGAVGIMTHFAAVDADLSVALEQTSLGLVNHIQGVHHDGFQVGTSANVNANGVTYYWVALGAITSGLVAGGYTGDGQDSRPITGIGYQPVCVIVKATGTGTAPTTGWAALRGSLHSGDSSQTFRNLADAANRIESIDSDGFTVGSDDMVNKNETPYQYIAIGAGGTPVAGKPAKWVSKWRVPLGKGADSETLATVYDESGAGDDTWATNYGLAAQHFQTKGNKLARAYQDNKVSLCSHDDITNLDHWGAGYPIGHPDTVITDLLEWADELLVPCTDGMYRFDTVALVRQQLPLMGGLKDDDNGKNSLVWGSQVLIPTADGLWRWQYGAHKTVGPDSIRGYVPAKETSNEPIHLKHYGSAFLGDHVYDAAYDGTNYLIFYSRPVGDAFIMDCLISTTNAIKCLHIDPDRRLWFGYGNNLAWIQLSKGGAPDGGNFGNVSLVSTCYLPEKILADDVDVRLRMVKVNCRNSDAEYKWELHASRDGAAFGAQIGEDITADGVNKRPWPPISNLTARRLRVKIVGTATASLTPGTTPPEIIGISFRGETKPDDAEIIKCVLDLNGRGRTPKKIKQEIAAHRNAGVRQVRNPITNEVESVIIYDSETVMVTQKGNEPPKAGLMIYMRRGDTS